MNLPGTHPVEISAYDRNGRHVCIEIPGENPVWGICKSQEQFQGMVDLHRPETNLNDPSQVFWEDHPNKW